MSGKIDTHFHIVPPEYAALLCEKNIYPGGIDVPKWSRDSALQVMDKNDIETPILSLSTPGVLIDTDPAKNRRYAKQFNEYTADIVRSDPKRFGFFATLTLPDVEGSIGSAQLYLR